MLRAVLRPRRPLSFPYCIALVGVLAGGGGCFPFEGLPDVDLDTSVFDRSGFAPFSLEGTWLLTNSQGQSRWAVFDARGDLVSLELPSNEVFEVTDDDTVEVFVTSFGAVSFKVSGQTEESDGVITLHEFVGLFSDDESRIRGTSPRVADNLSSSRGCDCTETWEREP